MTSPLHVLNDQLTSLIASVLPSTVTIEGCTADLGESQGSGWIYDSERVVTNHHVIEGLIEPFQVRPVGRPSLEGRVIGSDRENDIALIKVEGLAGVPLELERNPARIGELCIAIGTPHSYRESASLGIISGLSRQLRTEKGVMEELIQTDASVLHGNSGGPLVNIDGRVLGMNTRGPAETVNFAVPADTIAHVLPELEEHGDIQRATIGISISAIQRDVSGAELSSIVVKKVKSQQECGLRKGDILKEVNGISIRRRLDVIRALNRETIGRPIMILVERSGEDFIVEVKPERR